jgi:nitrite reductase/ring-hydroxylating ferredoxin subunit
MKTDGVMEAARRLHFDLTMCFSCSFFDGHKANVMPAIERTVVSDLPSHRPVDETLHSFREMSVFLKQFRDTHGKIGLLDEHCSHRGTSLFYGRNEECGLRCIYHGWKYDFEGNVLETPAEPFGSQLKNKVHHTAYPCVEAGGVVFTYMGAR